MKKLSTILWCLLVSISWASAQSVQVTGNVISGTDNEPVIGATVIVKGTSIGTVTDYNGDFSLNVPDASETLIFSYLGMKSIELPASANMRVVLHDDSQALDEVVVTALGISREKKALGYAVTEVSGDEMLKARGGVSNPINSLQGKVAGLQITGGAGSMGGSSKVLIRGVKSISGNNQPLFVVDGVPIEGQDFNSKDTQRGAKGYDYGNLIQDINPDDIESISVLKGPNASALYGSRATNGVIMITTKKGTKNEGYGVTFNSSISFEKVNKLPKLQKLYGGGFGFEEATINGKTYLVSEMAEDMSWGPRYEGQEYLSWYDIAKWEAGGKMGNPSTSRWQTPKNDFDTFFETGVAVTNNVSISQASDNAAVRISYTNSDLTGYMPNSSLRKNTFNVAASTTSADKKLEVFTNVTYMNTAAKGRSEIGYGDNNVMVKFVQWGQRQLDMKELKNLYKFPDGTQASWNRESWDDPSIPFSNNMYWTRYMNYQNDRRNRIYGNVGVSYKILDNLKFQYKANLDFFSDKQYERNAVYSNELSRYKELARQQRELNHEFLLMYNAHVNDFTYNVNVGSNLMSRRYEEVFGETDGGLAIPEFYNLKNSVNPAKSENEMRKKVINSVFGSATVGWRSMVYLDLSLRNDWSSTLPKGNNSYIYPSVTGSWIFSETFKESLPWMSFGKVRLGYAMVGNDTDPYQVIDTYKQFTNITSTPGYVLQDELFNNELKPESTTSYEVGLEMSFLNNRIGFETTFYASETKDQIIPLSVSGSTGYIYRVVNAGKMSNKGVEFNVYGTPVQLKDFSWETSLVLASNRNKVKELLDGVDYFRLTNAPFQVEIGAVKGGEYGVIMGTDYLYDDNGNRMIDEDGFYMSTNGNVPLGKVFPDFTGGWTNTFRYKNFDLSILLDFSKGGKFHSTSYMWGMYSGMLEESAAINENGKNIRDAAADGGGVLLQGVHADGKVNATRIEGMDYGFDHYTGPAAQNILKSDYVKLREINVGYTIPLKRDIFVKSLRVSAYGRNLAVWGPDTKHFDPEMIVTSSGNVQGVEGGALPSVATFGLNVSLKF